MVDERRTCKKLFTLLDLCVSSLRRGHANLLCIVPILTDDPRRESMDACRRARQLKTCSPPRSVATVPGDLGACPVQGFHGVLLGGSGNGLLHRATNLTCYSLAVRLRAGCLDHQPMPQSSFSWSSWFKTKGLGYRVVVLSLQRRPGQKACVAASAREGYLEPKWLR